MHGLAFLLSRQCGVKAELAKMVTNTPFSKVLERIRQLSNYTVYHEIFMHGHVVVPGAAVPKEPNLVIGVDTGMAHPLSIKNISPRNFIRNRLILFPSFNPRPDFCLERLKDAFICVDNEDPFRRHLVHPIVFLCAEARPWPHKYLGSGGASEFGRAVGAFRIYHNTLCRPIYRCEALLNIGLFVFRDDDAGKRWLSGN